MTPTLKNHHFASGDFNLPDNYFSETRHNFSANFAGQSLVGLNLTSTNSETPVTQTFLSHRHSLPNLVAFFNDTEAQQTDRIERLETQILARNHRPVASDERPSNSTNDRTIYGEYNLSPRQRWTVNNFMQHNIGINNNVEFTSQTTIALESANQTNCNKPTMVANKKNNFKPIVQPQILKSQLPMGILKPRQLSSILQQNPLINNNQDNSIKVKNHKLNFKKVSFPFSKRQNLSLLGMLNSNSLNFTQDNVNPVNKNNKQSRDDNVANNPIEPIMSTQLVEKSLDNTPIMDNSLFNKQTKPQSNVSKTHELPTIPNQNRASPLSSTRSDFSYDYNTENGMNKIQLPAGPRMLPVRNRTSLTVNPDTGVLYQNNSIGQPNAFSRLRNIANNENSTKLAILPPPGFLQQPELENSNLYSGYFKNRQYSWLRLRCISSSVLLIIMLVFELISFILAVSELGFCSNLVPPWLFSIAFASVCLVCEWIKSWLLRMPKLSRSLRPKESDCPRETLTRQQTICLNQQIASLEMTAGQVQPPLSTIAGANTRMQPFGLGSLSVPTLSGYSDYAGDSCINGIGSIGLMGKPQRIYNFMHVILCGLLIVFYFALVICLICGITNLPYRVWILVPKTNKTMNYDKNLEAKHLCPDWFIDTFIVYIIIHSFLLFVRMIICCVSKGCQNTCYWMTMASTNSNSNERKIELVSENRLHNYLPKLSAFSTTTHNLPNQTRLGGYSGITLNKLSIPSHQKLALISPLPKHLSQI